MKKDAETVIEERATAGRPEYATAYAILKLRDEVARCAYALKQIGTGDVTPGALEFIGMHLRDGIKVTVNGGENTDGC